MEEVVFLGETSVRSLDIVNNPTSGYSVKPCGFGIDSKYGK